VTDTPAADLPGAAQHARFSRRMFWLTFAFGLGSAVLAGLLMAWRAGAGIAVGTVLAWLNYRWLDRGLSAIVSASLAQEGLAQPRVPGGTYLGFTFRYALIAAGVYVTVKCFGIPVLALFGGLLSVGAAAVTESLYEVFTGSV
jgi:ATP synthase I chain